MSWANSLAALAVQLMSIFCASFEPLSRNLLAVVSKLSQARSGIFVIRNLWTKKSSCAPLMSGLEDRMNDASLDGIPQIADIEAQMVDGAKQRPSHSLDDEHHNIVV